LIWCLYDITNYTIVQSFFLGAGPEAVPPHVHHSSFEVNDFDTQCLGHDFLLGRGWTNCWGVGRHVLGSQIFDYWCVLAPSQSFSRYSDADIYGIGLMHLATSSNITQMAT
jgi:hypothetical protein